MKIRSLVFNDGEKIPTKYTCEGPNISPPLIFEDVPTNTKSLVLLVEDPDAKAKPWVHWLVFNIPANAKGFNEDSIAEGSTQGLCNGNTFGYEGPCPPENEHRYLFKLYALNKILAIPNTSDRKVVLKEMKDHVLAEATLTGKYEKATIKINH